MIVAFDGPDGIGKTTQVQLAAEYLRQQGRPVHVARASGGTPIGEELRKVSLSDTPRPVEVDVYISLAMHTALGLDLQERQAKGQTCIIDRSPLAIVAYNIFGSQLPDKQLGYDAYERMLKLWPLDLLVVFTANQQVLDERRHGRAKQDAIQANNYFENQDEGFRSRVQDGYRQAATLVRDHPEWGIRLVEISAEGTVEDVQNKVQQELLAG